MATRYFLKDTNAQTTCDASDNPLDLSQTQGTGATTVGSVNNTSFVEEFVWDIDVSGDSPVTGTFDVSVSVNAIDADTEGRFRVQVIDDTGCAISQNSAYSSLFTTTGVKTFTTASLTWGAGDERLRVSLEYRRSAGHGGKAMTIDVNHADSWIDAPWGGGSTTLVADSGSYNITGTDANLERNLLIGADSGSYSITGADAGLLKSINLNAESGSYSITGTDAGLKYNQVLAADAGGYALTGTDADLLYNQILNADAGSYSLTGTDANLTVSIKLTAESGSYTVTGTAANFLFDFVLNADAGAYNITGADAGLLRNQILGADPGSYLLTGNDATLTYNPGGAPPVYWNHSWVGCRLSI